MEQARLITLEQFMVIGDFDLTTYDGKMKAISKAYELLDLPTEDDKQNILEAILENDFEFDTGIYYIDTKKPFYDPEFPEVDGFLMIGREKNPNTQVVEEFFGIDDFRVATGFTKEDLTNRLIGKYQIYNNENFILTEYQAHKYYDRENFDEWLSSKLIKDDQAVEETEKDQSEPVEEVKKAPRKVKASIGRAR